MVAKAEAGMDRGRSDTEPQAETTFAAGGADPEVRTPEPPSWLLGLMDHIEGQVAFGDTKAGLLLTADSILLAGLATAFGGEHPLVADSSALSTALAVLALIALSAGVVAALLTVLPNRKNLWQPTPRQCRFSFGWIAREAKPDQLRQLALRDDVRAMREELADVIHGKSRWARRKFIRLYVAVWATVVGVVSALAAVGAGAL